MASFFENLIKNIEQKIPNVDENTATKWNDFVQSIQNKTQEQMTLKNSQAELKKIQENNLELQEIILNLEEEILALKNTINILKTEIVKLHQRI